MEWTKADASFLAAGIFYSSIGLAFYLYLMHLPFTKAMKVGEHFIFNALAIVVAVGWPITIPIIMWLLKKDI